MIKFSVEHPVSVLMLIPLLILGGGISAGMLPVNLLPEIPEHRLLVSCEFDGVNAEEMRKLVAIPLENALAVVKGVKTVKSVSRDGIALVDLDFHWGTDIDVALIDCREAVDLCYTILPSNCAKPKVFKSAPLERTDSVVLAVKARDGDLVYASYLLENGIKERFSRLSCAGAVRITGGEKERVNVAVSRAKMESKSLLLTDIAELLSAANLDYPAGTVNEGRNELLVKTAGRFASLDEMHSSPLSYDATGIVRLSDIAAASRGKKDKESFFLFDGEQCIRLAIDCKAFSSPLKLSNEVKNEIAKIEELCGENLIFQIISDKSIELTESLEQLFIACAIGVAVTFLVILFFFGSVTLSLILASLIPLSICAVFPVFFFLSRTINIMSLSGFALGIGMVVDSGAVTLENIQRLARESAKKLTSSEVAAACGAVMQSNIGSAMTTVIVFVPILFMQGVLNILFADLAIAIIVISASGCFFSFTLIPALFMLLQNTVPRGTSEGAFMLTARSAYLNVLQKTLSTTRNRKLLFAAFAAVSVACIVPAHFLRFELMPALRQNSCSFELSFPHGTKIGYMEDCAKNLYDEFDKLKASSGIRNLAISGGIEKNDYEALALPESRSEKICVTFQIDYAVLPSSPKTYEKLKEQVAKIAGGNIAVQLVFVEAQNSLSEIFASFFSANKIVTADSPEKLRDFVRFSSASGEHGAQFVPNEIADEMVFSPDRVAASRMGVNILFASQIIRTALEGISGAHFYENGKDIPVDIHFDDAEVKDAGFVQSLNVPLDMPPGAGGAGVLNTVPVRMVGKFEVKTNEKIFFRYNRSDAKKVLDSGFDSGLDFGLNPDAAKIGGVSLVETQKTEKNTMRLNFALVLGVSFALLYLLLAAQFESFAAPLIFLTAIPPVFSGSFFALLVCGKSMNINTVIAMVILFGITVNNSILLYEAYISGTHNPHARQTRGNMDVAVVGEKFRAILVTNLTTIFALVPVAVDVANTSAQSSLSIALIGGLSFSLIASIFVVPAIMMNDLGGHQQRGICQETIVTGNAARRNLGPFN